MYNKDFTYILQTHDQGRALPRDFHVNGHHAIAVDVALVVSFVDAAIVFQPPYPQR